MADDYYRTKESVAEYINLAKDVDSGNLIEKLAQVLPTGSKVLELGSGPGTDWKILSEIYNVVGSDYSEEFLKHLITRHPKGEFVQLDATTLKTDQKFDGIYANKVLHHLRDVELRESVKNQHRILHSDGIICHSFWKGEGTEIFKGLFVNYHTKKSLEDFYNDHFEILSLESYKEFDKDDSLVLIGRRK